MNMPDKSRVIVVGLVWNDRGELLLCKMKTDRGVFPGEWGLPGGGIEPGERMGDALRREMNEELGIQVTDIRPAFFKDGSYSKLLPNGELQPVYMIFLVFHCRAANDKIQLNEEFSEYRWVSEEDLPRMNLNVETADTLRRLGARGPGTG
jgi:nucleoside triphosphatase